MPTFESLRGRHEGSWAIVAGLGPSVHELPDVTLCLELTVNDGRKYRPQSEYAVTIDGPRMLTRHKRQFKMFERPEGTLLLDLVWGDWAKWVDKYGDYRAEHWLKNATRFHATRWAPRRGPLSPWSEELMYFGGTPFIACSMAAYLGADRVGVIGIDMSSSDKSSRGVRAEANAAYADLAVMLMRTGTELVSLSPNNVTTCLPQVAVEDFVIGPGE